MFNKYIQAPDVARLIRNISFNAYSATQVYNPAPKVQEIQKQMSTLEIGNLVVEITTIGMFHPDNSIKAVGYLEKIASEPVDFGDGTDSWDEEYEGRPHPTETVWYIRTFDGRLVRWINATFIAAPVTVLYG